MKTKRTVGIIALIIMGISFIAWMLLIFTGSAFAEQGGFSVLVPIIFILFAASAVTAKICLTGEAIKFAGKMFASGFSNTHNSSVNNNVKYCTKCGKQLEASAEFCSACGHKQN